MRSLSLGTILKLLLIVGILAWGPLSSLAAAQSASVSVPVGADSVLVVSAEQVKQVDISEKAAAAEQLIKAVGLADRESAASEEEQDSPTPVETSRSGADIKTPIALAADSLTYNADDDSYEAQGDVVLRQADVELRSDELLWQTTTQDASAQGHVQLNDAGTEVSGSRMQYNLATGQGQIRDGQVFVHEGNFHLTGEQIEKRSQAEYFVKKGNFTTCDGEVPDWKFSSREVEVTLGGYARAKHVWFHIRDVPVLYTPYLTFPVKTERESGLLTPSFGYSNNKGVKASLAWYQVIDRSMDATIYLDYLSEIGLGKGLEYRYALADQNNGEALYYHVTGTGEVEDHNEKQDMPDVYYLNWQHGGKLPGGWRLAADVEYTDNQLFFDEFGETAEDYNRDMTVSTLMLRRNWQKLNLVGHARYIKDLETDNDTTLQRLPELSLGLARHRLGETPFYASLESYATRFSRNEGEDGERLFLKPSLSAVFLPGSWLEIVPQVAFYERLYDAGSEDDEKFVPEFSLGLATRLIKNFDFGSWGVDRIQHSIEPKLVYTYIPEEDQDGLPLFDLHDRIGRQNEVSYALVNRLTVRSTAADGSRVYRELLNLRLSQSYDIDEARHDRSGQDQPFSDLRLEMDLRPTRKISLDLDSQIPVYGASRFHTLTAGVSARDDAGNAATVSYIYRDEEFAGIATDYLGLQLDTPVLKPVYIRFEERYDFREERELEKVLGLEYRSKCWSLLLTYRNRYRADSDDDREIMLSFILAGLGQNLKFGSGF